MAGHLVAYFGGLYALFEELHNDMSEGFMT